MRTVTLEEAQRYLEQLAEWVDQGEEVELIRPGKPSLTIVAKLPTQQKKRRLGRYKGQEPYYMSEDFNEPLPDAFWLGEDV
jgi:antitoxin (DNA-binding transcriptional repressor) of toxin-antitoxin stability system